MLPVLLIILMGLLDLGRLYYAYVAVTDAAGEGARYATVYPNDTNGIRARASEASSGLVQIDPNQVSVASSSQSIRVTVSYSVTMLTPLVNTIVPGGVIPLQAVVIEDL
jgi:Flp pilus assembly protein TadG